MHGFPSTAPATRTAGARFARTPSSTAIGDPATVDLCSTIDATSFTRSAYHAQFASEQYQPGCEVDLMTDARSGVEVSAYATPDRADDVAGRVTRQVAGQVVYAYPYDHGDCERDVAARGVTLVVETETHPSKAKADRAVNCAAADRMAAQLATGIVKRAFTPLRRARPSVLSLDSCRVAEAAGRRSPSSRESRPTPPTSTWAAGSIRTRWASTSIR
jgi:hypothetical protein